MAKGEIFVSYKLKPLGSKGLPLDAVLNSLHEQLLLERKRQQETLKANLNYAIGTTAFSNLAARGMTVVGPTTVHNYSSDEMTRSEAFRILSTWRQRVAIADFQKEHNFSVPYGDRPAEFKKVKMALWDNIMHSGMEQNIPEIKSPRLVLPKASSQYSCLLQDGPKLELFLKTIIGECLLTFEIPPKIYKKYKGWQATRPNIQLLNDEVTFIFTLKCQKKKPEAHKSTLGVDLGMCKPYAASLIDEKATSFRAVSVEAARADKALKKLEQQQKYVRQKQERRRQLGFESIAAHREEMRLREKHRRICESLDWQTAADVVSLAEAAGAQIAMENLSWARGGPVKFRHGLQQEKIQHIASKEGIPVVLVSAKNSSHECPACGSYVSPNSDREIHCECRYSGDRDEAASVVLGKRGAKCGVTPPKGRPTPKRPKPRRILVSMARRSGSTGPRPTVATGSIPATSVADYRSPRTGTVQRQWLKRSSSW